MIRRALPIISVLCVVLGLVCFFYCRSTPEVPMIERAYTLEGIVSLFPKTPDEITRLTKQYMTSAQGALASLIAVADDQRSFTNTALALDRISSLSNLALFGRVLYALTLIHPDDALRNAANSTVVEISKFFVDHVTTNKKLYDAFKAYANGAFATEDLSDEMRYFVTETLQDFERDGLALPQEQRERVTALKKELTELTTAFSKNINEDKSTITATHEQLAGLGDEFIATLKKDDSGAYILGVDYPTFFRVMENCAVEDTRKRLSKAFNNRAYPANVELLKTIIQKRDALAHELGFGSYAYLDLDDQMVQTPERATQFLYDVLDKAVKKSDQELDRLLTDLPESVVLTPDGKIKPWDIAYLKNQYKKKHLAIDEQAIADYFPTQKTIEGLLHIYQQFFDLDFKETTVDGLWHDELRIVQVYKKGDDTLLGTLILDLYPRPNKYSHACQLTIIPTIKNGKDVPNVSLVVANFPKATDTKPSLIKRSDVTTFFHEFGHALHAVLGQTQMGSFAGTNVKRDFVEMPSQMLEEWLWDKDILRSVSAHYQTGEPLQDDLLDRILALKTFDSGMQVHRQIPFGLLALAYYGPGAQKDPYTIMVDLYNRVVPRTQFDPDNHFYASFGHLTGYGAKYYGYLWSKVFALDLFEEIKKHGLLNPAIGKKYIDTVIGKGGSKPPRQLLVDFLGREPRIDAFIKDLGL